MVIKQLKSVYIQSVSRTSRETVYINTYPIGQRTVILKEDRYLELLDPESTKIFREGLLHHYINRPTSMKQVCLAEFASYYDYMSKTQTI